MEGGFNSVDFRLSCQTRLQTLLSSRLFILSNNHMHSIPIFSFHLSHLTLLRLANRQVLYIFFHCATLDKTHRSIITNTDMGIQSGMFFCNNESLYSSEADPGPIIENFISFFGLRGAYSWTELRNAKRKDPSCMTECYSLSEWEFDFRHSVTQ